MKDKDKKPASKYSLRGQLFVLIGTVSVLCVGVILLFFPLLNYTLEGLMDRSTQALQRAKEVDASTIARLMVLELARFKDLPQTAPGAEKAVDQDIKNLLWEKVTFNAIIEGIELIQRQTNSSGQHLTYLFYRRETPQLDPMLGPQKIMKKFSGLEEDLIKGINKRQVVDKNLLESVNRGPKPEGEMLLRYLPVHVLTPDEGAVYWGVAKIGISTRSLRQELSLQSREQEKVRKTIWLEIILSLTLSGVLAMSLIYFWVHNLTDPLKKLSAAAASLKTAKSQDFDLWLENLKRVNPRGQAEVAVIQEVLQRLGTAAPRLGNRLIAVESQASLGRVLARNLHILESWSNRLQVLGGEGETPGQTLTKPALQEMREILRNMRVALQDMELFLSEGEIKWRNFDPAPALQSAWRLVTLGLPPGVKRTLEIEPLPSIWGSPAELAQAVLHIWDFLADHLDPAGDLSLQARSTGSGSVQIILQSSGPVFSLGQCQDWLNPFQNNQEIQENLGPALAGAIASRHGGSLTLSPRGKGGLTFCLELPGAGGSA